MAAFAQQVMLKITVDVAVTVGIRPPPGDQPLRTDSPDSRLPRRRPFLRQRPNYIASQRHSTVSFRAEPCGLTRLLLRLRLARGKDRFLCLGQSRPWSQPRSLDNRSGGCTGDFPVGAAGAEVVLTLFRCLGDVAVLEERGATHNESGLDTRLPQGWDYDWREPRGGHPEPSSKCLGLGL